MKTVLYTIVFEFDEGTFIEQINGGINDSLTTIIEHWYHRLNESREQEWFLKCNVEIFNEINNGDLPTKLVGLVNVWCKPFTINDKLGLMNIIKTSKL